MDVRDGVEVSTANGVLWTLGVESKAVTNESDAHSTGAVWANVQNKQGGPAICTWSGDSLLKYFRATDDRRALNLLAAR